MSAIARRILSGARRGGIVLGYRRHSPVGIALIVAVGMILAAAVANAPGAVTASLAPAGATPTPTVSHPTAAVERDVAPQSVTTYSGWTGYDGSYTIYPTSDPTSVPLAIPTPTRMWLNGTNDTYSGSQYSFTDANGLALAISNQSQSSPSFQNLGNGNFLAQIWFDGSAGAQQYYTGSTVNQYDVLPYLLELSVSGPTLPSQASLQFNTEQNVAVNLTQPSPSTASTQQLDEMIAGMDIIAALLPEDVPGWIGLALSATGMVNDFGALFSTSSSGPSCVNSYPPGNSICQYGLVIGGHTSALGQSYGSNVFSQATGIQVEIPDSELASVTAGTIQFSASDELSWDHSWCVNHNCFNTAGDVTGLATSGATDLSYGIAPAVGIGGYVDSYPGGPAVGGLTFTLQQNCGGTLTDFDITASSTGYWHFFADPGCTYSYSATWNGWWYDYPVSFSTSGSFPSWMTATGRAGQDTETLNINMAGGVANFEESGLPLGTCWSVTYGGATESQCANTNSFLEVNGSYSYTVGSLAGYTESPTSGTTSISGDAVTVSVSYAAIGPYTVTMSQSGLPSSDSWSADVGSDSASGGAGATLAFSSLYGSNSYAVDEVIVSETCSGGVWLIKYYGPSPAGGTVTYATHISVHYTLDTKTFHFSCTGEIAGGSSATGAAGLGITPLMLLGACLRRRPRTVSRSPG
jgi:hypothetical protein